MQNEFWLLIMLYMRVADRIFKTWRVAICLVRERALRDILEWSKVLRCQRGGANFSGDLWAAKVRRHGYDRWYSRSRFNCRSQRRFHKVGVGFHDNIMHRKWQLGFDTFSKYSFCFSYFSIWRTNIRDFIPMPKHK